MPKFVATNFQISLNGVDLTSSLSSATLEISSNEVETTTFGTASTAYRTVVGGIVSGSVKLDFYQDYAAASVDATLNALINTIGTVVIKPLGSAVSATNPSYTATCLINNYTPVSGTIGDLSSFSVTWPTTGTITRATA
jgi:hypothetical protein